MAEVYCIRCGKLIKWLLNHTLVPPEPECDGCWELRTRIEDSTVMAKAILRKIDTGVVELDEDQTPPDTWDCPYEGALASAHWMAETMIEQGWRKVH